MNYSLTAILIDDEDNTRNLLKKIITDYIPEITIIGTESSANKGLELANRLKPDIVFLDIEMPGETGLSISRKFEYEPFIIFVTAHEHYAIKAIKAGAFDYLLKPIDIEELQASVEKIKISNTKKTKTSNPSINSNTQNNGNTLAFNIKEGILLLNDSEILKVEADGSYVTVFLINGEKHILSKNLKEFSEQLVSSDLFRCHASYLINLKLINKIIKQDGLFVELTDKSRIPVSRKYKEELLKTFNQ